MNVDSYTKEPSKAVRVISHVVLSFVLTSGFAILSRVVNNQSKDSLVASIQSIFRNDRDIGNTAHLGRRLADMETLGSVKCVAVHSKTLGAIYSTNFKEDCSKQTLWDRLFVTRANAEISSVEGDRYQISFDVQSNTIYRFYILLFFVLSLFIANALMKLFWYRIDLKGKELEREHELNIQLDQKVQQQTTELVNLRVDTAIQKSVAELARRVAHDIRSPISALLSLVSNHDKVEMETYRSIVEQVAYRITSIADDLLEKSKNHKAIPTSFNLRHSLSAILTEKKIEYQNQPHLNFVFSTEDIPEYSDVLFPEAEFGRIISNIINNSAEATERKGTIFVESRSLDGCLEITIRDDGKGIAQEVLERLMTEPISTKEKGSGIGIYHSHKLLSKYGHLLRVKSILGKGTQVTIGFRSFSAELTPERSGSDTNILLVDDDPTIFASVQINLKKEPNLRVLPAYSIQSAKQILERERIDLALVDYTLGDIKGTDLIKEIRKLHPTLKVILITGDELNFIQSDIDSIELNAILEKKNLHRDLLATLRKTIFD